MNASLFKKAFIILSVAISGGSLQAQNVAVVNGRPINASEFLWVYQKNNGKQNAVSYKELLSYLDLYVNFKLKVAEARQLGLDKDTTYTAEIASYVDALKNQKKIAPETKEYGFIINEYEEGVLMFNVSEQKIWNKTPENERELKLIFDQSDKYKGKTFEEVKGEVIADYQQKLEQDWIKELKSKYKVKINQAVLKKLAK